MRPASRHCSADPRRPSPEVAAGAAARVVREAALKRHLRGSLSKNANCEEALSFLGAGCWQHHVPAVVRRDRRPHANS